MVWIMNRGPMKVQIFRKWHLDAFVSHVSQNLKFNILRFTIYKRILDSSHDLVGVFHNCRKSDLYDYLLFFLYVFLKFYRDLRYETKGLEVY